MTRREAALVAGPQAVLLARREGIKGTGSKSRLGASSPPQPPALTCLAYSPKLFFETKTR